jgi:DNA-binding MarR family transcriptional regulator
MMEQTPSGDVHVGTVASVDRNEFFYTQGLRILTALRRIIRAVDIHSRKLNDEVHVTAPQMLCLYCLDHEGPMTQSRLSGAVNLGVSTVNGIIDRLESKGLVTRERSREDRRKVFVTVTDAGHALTQAAPALLQDRLSRALQKLPASERIAIAESLERVVALMESEDNEDNQVPAGPAPESVPAAHRDTG